MEVYRIIQTSIQKYIWLISESIFVTDPPDQRIIFYEIDMFSVTVPPK